MAGTYGGVTTISNGSVEIVGLTTALGNSSGKTVVHSNAMLRITSAGGTLGEPLELHGSGLNGTNAALHVVSGSTHQGSITVPIAAAIRCDGEFHATSVLAGAGDFRFRGAGEFWTQGNSPNTARAI